MTTQRKLVLRLVGAVATAFLASMALTWFLHDHMTSNEVYELIDIAFRDVEASIRERVDRRMIRQAMVVRDKLPEMQAQGWWNDSDESSRRLRALADELQVDEICVVNADGILTHSARREEVGALDFRKTQGQAREFAALLDKENEITQPIMPNSLRGEMMKYVGVWVPSGGFVQVGANADNLRRHSRTAVTGITHDWHVSGGDGCIVITTALGTVISHADPNFEGSQWATPSDDEFYWKERNIEGFSVYVVVPKKMAVVERRVLVATSSFLNGMALVLAAFLVGIVIASYVRSQLRAQREKEMKLAATIQESGLPRVFPPFPGEPRADFFADMKTAKEVGGDFYDFYFSGPRKITFLVADVSDKGVPAALFMMRAKATLKGIAQTGKPVAEVVTEANSALCQDNGANMFVTAWVGEVDLDTGVVSYVNAGHNPPLLLRAGKSAPEYIRSKPGIVLGVAAGMKYVSQEVRLAPGDSIYLYTDGLVEQPNAQGEPFGEERLEQVVAECAASCQEPPGRRSSPILGAVVASVLAHGGNVDQTDDCTQLLVRYNGAP